MVIPAGQVQVNVGGMERVEILFGDWISQCKDLTILFTLFASDFYKDEKRIFSLKSEGKYQPLTEKYAERKVAKYGFEFPILFASGRLAASLLDDNARDSILVIKKDAFAIGTSTPYAKYHHSKEPRTKMPRRPLWDEDPNGALAKRWEDTADVFFEKMLGRKPSSARRTRRSI